VGGGDSATGSVGSGSSGGGGTASSSVVSGVLTEVLPNGQRQPLAGANLKVEVTGFTGARAYSANTDSAGRWSIDFGTNKNLPPTFAGVFTKEGYKPSPVIFSATNGQVNGGRIDAVTNQKQEFDLDVINGSSIIHLGDSSFGGFVNSELQVPTSGISFSWGLQNVPARLIRNYDKLCILFVARGVQMSSGNANFINFDGKTQPLSDSPTDGGFGFQKNCFSTSNIASGENLRLSISSGTRGGTDFDDFEVLSLSAQLEEKNGKVDVLPTLRTPPVQPSGEYSLNTLPRQNAEFQLHNGFYPSGTAWVIWNFGDGTALRGRPLRPVDLEFSANPNISSITHSYGRSGSFTIRISYQDAFGAELAASTYTVRVL
jgi:hypothetical protein